MDNDNDALKTSLTVGALMLAVLASFTLIVLTMCK